MVKKYIVDSSVIVKLLNTTDEENIEAANNLLSDALRGNAELIAPELSKYEVGNVLLKSKKLNPPESDISFTTLYSLPITFITESEQLAKETFLLAYRHTITYYDASFLALAKLCNATLVTENIKHQGKSSDISVIPLKEYSSPSIQK
jgi:predicted nucleic acid-binding protein